MRKALTLLIGLILTIFGYLNSYGQNLAAKRLSEDIMIIENDTLHRISGNQYKKYFDSGKVEYEGELINDVKEGTWITYYEDGSTCKQIDYLKGKKNGKFIWYFPDGKKLQEVDIVNDIKHGKETYWNKDGTLNSISTFENGEQIEIRVYKPNYINTTDTATYNGDVIWRK
ncbi:MAG: toxin-antitoxin system YwqK family antitoxin [Luteibaculaceae bacterium]